MAIVEEQHQAEKPNSYALLIIDNRERFCNRCIRQLWHKGEGHPVPLLTLIPRDKYVDINPPQGLHMERVMMHHFLGLFARHMNFARVGNGRRYRGKGSGIMDEASGRESGNYYSRSADGMTV
ncbi:hypothetical protein CBL_05895 [Carabus blaptoides fortunei]